jgi:hypothetical protein
MIGEIERVLRPGGKFDSRSFASELFAGTSPVKADHLEYIKVFERPLAEKGLRASDGSRYG